MVVLPIQSLHFLFYFKAILYSVVRNLYFCVVMFGLINVNILYYSFSTLYQMCNLRQSL